jgi:DNA-binding GntR family transcriptional regulator
MQNALCKSPFQVKAQAAIRSSPAHRAPIRRVSLHDEVTARLRELVLEGELAPGSRVPERELCERFGVSRTPLREALKVLAAEGLVKLLPNRGAEVAQLTEREVEELFAVIALLEAAAGEAACRRITDEQIGEIRALHARMLACHEAGNRPAYFALNQQIHRRIVEIAGNTVLTGLYDGLSTRVRRARYAANLSHERWDEAVREHEAILDALAARDGARLGRLMGEHLRNKAYAAGSVLRDEQGD